jgi:hypothetical protein
LKTKPRTALPLLISARATLAFALAWLALASPVSLAAGTVAPSIQDTDDLDMALLTPEERSVLEVGEISHSDYVTGGVVGSIFGFGVGHAIQGRYLPIGGTFTTGEAIGAGLLVYGASNCSSRPDGPGTAVVSSRCSELAMMGGLLLFSGLRLWEILDLWMEPPRQNERFKQLGKQLGETTSTAWAVLPSNNGTVLGWEVHF